jgi:hypothetical protein
MALGMAGALLGAIVQMTKTADVSLLKVEAVPVTTRHNRPILERIDTWSPVDSVSPAGDLSAYPRGLSQA